MHADRSNPLVARAQFIDEQSVSEFETDGQTPSAEPTRRSHAHKSATLHEGVRRVRSVILIRGVKRMLLPIKDRVDRYEAIALIRARHAARALSPSARMRNRTSSVL